MKKATNQDLKLRALMGYLEDLEETDEDLFSESYENTYCVNNKEYLVLTDEEADEAVKKYISDSLWSFNYSFLSRHLKATLPQKFFQKMQEKLCEGCNELILALVKDMDALVSDAVLTDGRGHFLSSYDGEENEFFINDKVFYIYRLN